MTARNELGALEQWRWARRCAGRAPNIAGRTHWQRWQAAKAQVRALRRAELARALRRRVPLVVLTGLAAAVVVARAPSWGAGLVAAVGAALVVAWSCRKPIRRFRSEVPVVTDLREKTELAWWVAKKLAPLERRADFAVVHDLSLGPVAVLDHIVVGPHFVEPVFALRVGAQEVHDEGEALVTAEGRTLLVWDNTASWVRHYVPGLAGAVEGLGFSASSMLVLLHGPQNYDWWARRQDQVRVLVATVDAATDHFASAVSDGLLAHPPAVIAQAADAIRSLYPPRNETVNDAEFAPLFTNSTTDA